MDDFASTALYDLIAAQLQAQGMDTRPSNRFEGKTERSQKSNLLEDALANVGASAIVAIGQGIHRVEANPTLAVLVRADSPIELLHRWQRLERYYHGKHRVRILEQDSQTLTLEHYSVRRSQPSAGEDLVIAGLVAALLQAIGCQALSMHIGDAQYIEKDRVATIRAAPPQTSVWHFRWHGLIRQSGPAESASPSASPAQRVAQLIGADLGRTWRLASVAALLGSSGRSLQRALAREDTSFQHLLRTIRAERSAQMIAERNCSLAEAGYACGFSDQAHFSREFKLRFNMSPSQFMAIAEAR